MMGVGAIKEVLQKAAFKLTFFSFLNIILTFGVQLLTAFLFGTSAERDVYFASIAVPTYVTATIVGSINVLFLPQLITARNSSISERVKFLSGSIFSLLMLLLAICIIIYIFLDTIINITAPGFNETQKHLSRNIMMVLIPSICFQCLFNILSLTYNAFNRFLWPALMQLAVPVFSLIVTIFFYKKLGIMSLAIGYSLGTLITFLATLPILYKLGFLLVKPRLETAVKMWYVLSFPLILTSIISRSAQLVERVIASTLPIGSLSVIGYANQMMMTLCTIVSSGISILAFSSLSTAWVKDNKTLVIEILYSSLITILVISFTISGIIFLFSGRLITAVFAYGSMSESDAEAIGLALTLMIGAFIGNSLGTVIGKCFYISGRTRSMAIFEICSSIFYLLTAFFLTKRYGLHGLAISASFGSLFSVAVSFWAIMNYIPELRFGHIVLQVLKLAMSTAIACAFGFLLYRSLTRSVGIVDFPAVIVGSLFIIVVQVALCKVFRIRFNPVTDKALL
jgi:putative peptidoglycan lipid II flippase